MEDGEEDYYYDNEDFESEEKNVIEISKDPTERTNNKNDDHDHDEEEEEEEKERMNISETIDIAQGNGNNGSFATSKAKFQDDSASMLNDFYAISEAFPDKPSSSSPEFIEACKRQGIDPEKLFFRFVKMEMDFFFFFL